MTSEYEPKPSARQFGYLEILAEAKYPYIFQVMDSYVASRLVKSSESFGHQVGERIDTIGQELAYRLIGYTTTERDILDMQKCVRFGVTLVRLLTDSPRYSGGLHAVEELFSKKADLENIVGGSYDRYLRLYPRLAETVLGNLPPMTHEACRQPGRNVISFLLEEAEPNTEAYVDIQTSGFDEELRRLLDRPPDMPSE